MSSAPGWQPSAPAENWSSLELAAPAKARSAAARSGRTQQAAYAAIDCALVCFGGAAALWLRFGISAIRWDDFLPASAARAYPGFLILYAGLVVLACISFDLYRTARDLRPIDETIKVSKAISLATALLVLFIFTSGNKEISRLVVALSGMLSVTSLAGWRYAKRRYVLRRAARGEGLSRVLIIGAGKTGKALAGWLQGNRQLGYSVCGFLDAHPNGDPSVLGSIEDLRQVALAQFADQLFITLPAERELVKKAFLEARHLRINLNVVPDLYDGLAWRAPVQSLGGFPMIELHGQPIPVLGLAVKRFIDLCGSAIGLALASPLLAVAALWIRLDSRGPIFYAAPRVGRKGRKFNCYKLRTMVAEADEQKENLRRANERDGPFFKMEEDPRVTRSGRWLRKYSVDELPQLVNVLLGQMSLVGPRPHPVDDVSRYSIEHLRRLDVKPGITGLWQVKARRDPSFEANMALDLEYIENWSLRMDLLILWQTMPIVVQGEGA